MADPTANPPETPAADVLTLHRGIVARWTEGHVASHGRASAAIGHGSSTLLGDLAGLATLPTSFSIDAFQIATLLASLPRVSASLGPELRSMAVGDIADLVQIVLEQEETDAQAAPALGGAAASGRRAGKKTTAAPRAQRAAAPAQARTIAAVQRALQAVRREAARRGDGGATLDGPQRSMATVAPFAADGAQRTAAAASLGTTGPTQVDSHGIIDVSASMGLRGALHRLRADPQVRASVATLDPSAFASSALQLNSWTTATRALRLADGDADRALLQPGLEVAAEAGAAAQARAGQRLGAAQQGPGSLDGAARRDGATAATAAAGLAGAWGAPLAAPSERTLRMSAALNQLRGAAPVGVTRRNAQGQIAAGQTPTGDTGIAASWDVASRGAAARTMPALPALASAVGGAAGLMQRAAAGIARWARPATGDTPWGGGVGDGVSAGAASVAALRALHPLADSDALAALRPLATTAGLQRWLGASEALLGGASAAPAVVGYRGLELGAGTALELGAAALDDAGAAAPGEARPGRATPGTALRTAATAPTASTAQTPGAGAPMATPAWLAPLAATRLARARAQATRQLGRDAEARTTAPAAAGSVADTAAGAGASAWTGGAGLAAFGLGLRVSERVALGLEPVAETALVAATRSGRPLAERTADPGAFATAFGARLPGAMPAAAGLGSGADTWLRPLIDASALGAREGAVVTTIGGALAANAGVGDWLALGDDVTTPIGADTASSAGSAGRSATASRAAAPRAAVPEASTATRALQTVLTRAAAAQAAGGGRAAIGGAPAALLPSVAAALATLDAAGARVAAGVPAARLAQGVPTAGGAGLRPLAFAQSLASGDSAGVLEVLAGGRVDAMAPWLGARALERGAASAARPLRTTEAGAGTMLEIGEDVGSDAPQAAAPSAPATTAGLTRARAVPAGPAAASASPATGAAARPSSMGAAGTGAIAHQQLQRALQRAGAGGKAGALAAALLTPSAPPALRAALALFGESTEGGSADVASRFVARWLGSAEPRTMATADVERVALQPTAGAPGALARAVQQAAALARGGAVAGSERAAAAGEQRVVFEGLGALSALRSLRGAGDAEAKLLELGRVETVPAGADAVTGRGGEAGGGRAAAGASAAGGGPRELRAGTAARTHRFAPVGLARTHHALRRSGRDGLLRSVHRGDRLGGGRGASRVGYGSAGLGGGALVGLGAHEPIDALYGGGYASTGAMRRAERLGDAVFARRGGGTAGGSTRMMPAGGQPTELIAHPGSSSLEQAFGAPEARSGDLKMVSTATVAQAVAGSRGPDAGATASAKVHRAGSMARVLSVTAAPAANMLPLVAPAARALVAQAAAKPMAESISTSGANGTMALPVAGHDVSGGGGAGSGMGATAEERKESGTPGQQELEALAMKIARSVLVRIKRERERRGIHV